MLNLVNVVFPPTCLFCATINTQAICPKCLNELYLICSTNCIYCDQPTLFGLTHLLCLKSALSQHASWLPDSLLCLYKYEHYVRDCIRKAKYQANEFMGLKQAFNHALTHLTNVGYTPYAKAVVIPIPLSNHKLRHRGFNQAEILATVFSKTYGLNINTKLLIRTHDTLSQYTQTRLERHTNLKGAFALTNTQLITNKVIYLVDDVCTTGATLKEAATVLKLAGANQVHCITMAKKEKLDQSPQKN